MPGNAVKIVPNPNAQPMEEVPEISATPVEPRRGGGSLPEIVPVRPPIPAAESAAGQFLRQFRVLLGVTRLYDRHHPRFTEILASTEQQLRIALALQSPFVLAVERNGFTLPRNETSEGGLLRDPRGELSGLAGEFLKNGICSLQFAQPIHAGELDLLAHEMIQTHPATPPGDTAARKAWDGWLREKRVTGIRLNVATERRDSLLLASLVSAVLAHDDEPQRSPQSRENAVQPAASREQVAATLRLLAKLAPPSDPGTRASAEEVARRFHSIVNASERAAVSLIVHGVSQIKPREGETLDLYLNRLADAVILAYARQEFDAGRATPPDVASLLIHLEQDRSEAAAGTRENFAGSHYDEKRAAALCEKFWSKLPARLKARTLRGKHAWCVPGMVLSSFLEPLAAAADGKKVPAAGKEGRAILLSYARCLESEEGKARRAVALGLAEIAPQVERLWPHPEAQDFGRGIVRALLLENSPGIGGLLSAAVENLARVSLEQKDFAEFERILEALEAAPRDITQAHIAMLIAHILNDEHWLTLVDESLSNRPLDPVIPRLLRRRPDRLIDRLGLLLTSPDGMNLFPAMVRLVHATGESVLGALEFRLLEPRRQRVVTAIQLLGAADPKRLAGAFPKSFAGWEWSLQDLAVTELMKWTNPPVTSAAARAFLAVLPEAHSMVVPCMIDHLGMAHEISAVPMLMQIVGGEHPQLRDIFLRIKAVEALGRMRVAEAAPLLLRIVRDRNGLTHSEPSALRSVAEETLGLLENRPSSARIRMTESARVKTGLAHPRTRRYLRVRLESPLPAVLSGPRGGAGRVSTIALGGAFLETSHLLSVGESAQLEIRAGMKRIQTTAVVRSVSRGGVGVEFVHLTAESRERLRRLVTRELD
jgi:hypothetical protein